MNAHRHSSDLLALHALELIALPIGGLANGTMGHLGKGSCQRQKRNEQCRKKTGQREMPPATLVQLCNVLLPVYLAVRPLPYGG